jgi:hypothetical protein
MEANVEKGLVLAKLHVRRRTLRVEWDLEG